MTMDPKDRAPGFSLSLSVDDFPDHLAQLRCAVAKILRNYADEMDGPATREDLHALADAFEAGQAPDGLE